MAFGFADVVNSVQAQEAGAGEAHASRVEAAAGEAAQGHFWPLLRAREDELIAAHAREAEATRKVLVMSRVG